MVKNKFLILICSSTMLLFVTCKKEETVAPPAQTNPPYLDPKTVSMEIIGNWIWDSTSLFSNNTLKHTYTTTGLKSYLTSSTSIVCNTNCTFTLNFTKEPFNNLSDGLGYVNSYSLATPHIYSSADKVSIKGASDLTDSTQSSLNDTWKWLVYPGPGKNTTDVYIFLNGNNYPFNQCVSYTAVLVFVGQNYLIKSVTDHSLELLVVENAAFTYNSFKFYFHR